jgi:peptidoglycan-associated lipoprotein
LIHFEFDKADIRASDQTILDRKAAILAANSAVRLQIAGHCDERGSDE